MVVFAEGGGKARMFLQGIEMKNQSRNHAEIWSKNKTKIGQEKISGSEVGLSNCTASEFEKGAVAFRNFSLKFSIEDFKKERAYRTYIINLTLLPGNS